MAAYVSRRATILLTRLAGRELLQGVIADQRGGLGPKRLAGSVLKETAVVGVSRGSSQTRLNFWLKGCVASSMNSSIEQAAGVASPRSRPDRRRPPPSCFESREPGGLIPSRLPLVGGNCKAQHVTAI